MSVIFFPVRAVFIAADLTKTRQKLLSHFQIDIGTVPSQASKSITFNVVSLIEGTVELSQKLWYQMDPNVAASSGQLAASKSDESTKPNAPAAIQQRKQQHNICIEHVNDVLVKSKKDTISVPCTAEFLFSGKFYSLNKEALTRAFIGEDFLFRVELEVKSVPIDILDMFLISVSNAPHVPRRLQPPPLTSNAFFFFRITMCRRSRSIDIDANTARRTQKARKCVTFVCCMRTKRHKSG